MKMVGVPLKGAVQKPRSGALPSKCGSTLNMAANIKVVVRVRPLNEKEREANHRVVVELVDNSMLVFDPKEETRPFFYQGVQQPAKYVLRRANKELKFVFDNVLGQTASNRDIFELTTKDVLVSLMEGYNCSVFAYGATGAGKTFTMIGSVENPGITYLTMDHLFYTIDSFEKEREFDIGVSYIEVYNENVFDLLKPSKTPLQLREDAKYGVMVAGLTLHKIKTARQLLNMLENGNKNRTQHPTDANAESSRSHAVFQVYIKMRYKTSSQARVVKLSMIDLAGSERASATGCVGERFKEGANINRSLLSLGNCINKLADGSSYIPYRDSKLTRLLKDSLGGNCKTVMIANISPSSVSYEDTYNTLKYAARANKIQLSVKKSIVDGDTKVTQYAQLVEELNGRIAELEAKLSLAHPGAPPSREAAKAEWRRRIAEEAKCHAALESRLFELRGNSRVLALRHRLRARAYRHVAALAHRSSNEAMELMVTEDIPRQERAAESYEKKARRMDSQILQAQTECDKSWKKLQLTMDEARRECPELEDYIDKVLLERELRLTKACNDLKTKLISIQNKEIELSTEYMLAMPKMLRKLYLTLKGYDKLPPALAAEYADMMKKAKSIKSITWDTESECNDPYFQYMAGLDTDESDFCLNLDKFDATEDVATNSEDTDTENRDPSPKKRKGTPIKLANNQTIVIDDSFDNFDSTRNLNSAKKVKRDADIVPDIENCGEIDPKELNSTFVLAAKMNAMKKRKVDPGLKDTRVEPVAKRGLTDRTNVQRTINFNDRAKIAKPVANKVVPGRRAAPRAAGPGFGSSVARDGTPLYRDPATDKVVGYKAVRARDRPAAAHPYRRPPRPGAGRP